MYLDILVMLSSRPACDEWEQIWSFQGPTEKEQIDIQGDIIYDIVEFITRHLAWCSITILLC